MFDPGLTFTVAATVIGLLIGGFANWQLRRPVDLRWPIVPWLGVQFIAVAIVLVFAAHLISLLTGHPFGRNGGS
jgi:hypothetical protein